MTKDYLYEILIFNTAIRPEKHPTYAAKVKLVRAEVAPTCMLCSCYFNLKKKGV